MNPRTLLLLCALAALPACQVFDRLYPPSQYDGAHVPSAPAAVSPDAGATIQQTAKTTLLLENENLRDQLAAALEDKRKLQSSVSRATEELDTVRQDLKAREDAIASLSEQMQSIQARLDAITIERDRLGADRKTLAEMYALEKKQRLAFEKELLEREIAERTHATRSTGDSAGSQP